MNAELRTILLGLDALIRREILRLRARYQLSLNEFRGLYIGDEQVDALVGETAPDAIDLAAGDSSLWRDAVVAASMRDARLMRLTGMGLSALELAVLFIALAPGLEAKYETLYAYLNNDVTRKLPTLELALALICANDEERLDVRRALGPQSRLITTGLVRLHPHRDGVPGAAGQIMFSAHAGLANYLLGLPFLDEQIAEALSLHRPRGVHAALPERLRTELARRMRRAASTEPTRVVLLEPSSTLSAAVFATALCGPSPLAVLDLRRVARDALHDSHPARHAVCEGQRISASRRRRGIAARLERADGTGGFRLAPSLAHGGTAGPSQCRRASRFDLRCDGTGAYRATNAGTGAAPRDLECRPTATELPPTAATSETSPCASGSASRLWKLQPRRLLTAARMQTARRCSRRRARNRTRSSRGWRSACHNATCGTTSCSPQRRGNASRSLIDALAARDLVLGHWGLGATLGNGGLRALFAGPSGTGKTMAAERDCRASWARCCTASISR